MTKNSEQIIEHLFREEYGKLVVTLTKAFGSSHIQLAEDMVQETLISAINNWSTQGIPSNPTGWLFQVAKRKALNELKRNKMILDHHTSGGLNSTNLDEIGTVFLEDEIQDNQLRMIFTCCHYSLDTKSQIALTLKTLCGFGVKEIANALLQTESSIQKRLYRAKEKIKQSEVPFDVPQGQELAKRLDTVCLTLYLLFNEGYNSSTGDSLIQKELCLEAMRLVKLLVSHFKKNHKLSALLSLMCFHTARFDSRIDNQGAIILFEDQDRSRWNRELITIGFLYFKQSIHGSELSTYHIEARIASEHCLAESFEKTNWSIIHDQYSLLAQINPNPIIKLNLAIIESKLTGIKASLKQLEKLKKELKQYHLLVATQATFQMELKNYQEALTLFNEALSLNPPKRVLIFIEQKIVVCREKIQMK